MSTIPGLPQIRFGDYAVSRLILGANPINGGSHLSRFVNLQMKRYFTPERVLELLRHCEGLGINAWQSGSVNLDGYKAFRAQGGKMYYISLAREDPADPDMLQRLAAAGTIAIAHHGEVTDTLWRSGKIDRVRAYCKKIRDAGVMVGVSTHMPVVLDHIISANWDVDF